MLLSLDEKIIKFLENTCIFCQPWWLQAVSPDHWDVVTVMRGGEVAAVWPYTYKIRLGIFRMQELPFIFSYLGPWFRESNAKYAKRISNEKDLIFELIDKLPPFATFNQWFHPSVTNWLPLYWKGFKQTTRYTYIIDRTQKTDMVWDQMLENIRREIRKAEKSLRIIEEQGVTRFLDLLNLTFSRQGLSLPFPEETLFRLDAECEKRGVRKVLLAVDSENRPHAGIYLVWDKTAVYAILRGSDHNLRTSGASSLLAWKAIDFALSQKKKFDFAGSWVESIERFVRAFGAKQTPFFEISKMNSRIVKGYRTLWKWIH